MRQTWMRCAIATDKTRCIIFHGPLYARARIRTCSGAVHAAGKPCASSHPATSEAPQEVTLPLLLATREASMDGLPAGGFSKGGVSRLLIIFLLHTSAFPLLSSPHTTQHPALALHHSIMLYTLETLCCLVGF
jgi:hypothetical protein